MTAINQEDVTARIESDFDIFSIEADCLYPFDLMSSKIASYFFSFFGKNIEAIFATMTLHLSVLFFIQFGIYRLAPIQTLHKMLTHRLNVLAFLQRLPSAQRLISNHHAEVSLVIKSAGRHGLWRTFQPAGFDA